MKRIPLTQGKFAIVDDRDFKSLSAFKWYARKAKHTFYAVRNTHRKEGGTRRTVYLHRDLLDLPVGIFTDHKDGNGLDNRRNNLRPATRKLNRQGFRHKPLGAVTRFRGVTWHTQLLKWQARIMIGSQRVSLGCFKHEVEAARAYDKKAIELGFFEEALNFKI